MDTSASALQVCTAKIVASYLSHHTTAASEVPDLISIVHGALAASTQPVLSETRREPAVPIKRSVRADSIVCLECGYKGKILKRHLGAAHGLTPEDYRRSWNLSNDYPLIAPNYSHVRSMFAKQIGLGLRRQPVPVPTPVRGRPRVLRAHTPQTPAQPVSKRRGRPRRAAQ